MLLFFFWLLYFFSYFSAIFVYVCTGVHSKQNIWDCWRKPIDKNKNNEKTEWKICKTPNQGSWHYYRLLSAVMLPHQHTIAMLLLIGLDAVSAAAVAATAFRIWMHRNIFALCLPAIDVVFRHTIFTFFPSVCCYVYLIIQLFLLWNVL